MVIGPNPKSEPHELEEMENGSTEAVVATLMTTLELMLTMTMLVHVSVADSNRSHNHVHHSATYL